jgi:nicotinate-nucleotide pyrophosphorylase (carboxylating)
MIFDITHPDVRRIVSIALEEDVRTGDITTNSTVDASIQAEGRFMAKQELTLAGVELLALLYDQVDFKHKSGDRLQFGDIIAVVRGPARTLLTHERVALNFLQRLSGVATIAAQFVSAIHGTKARMLDTRKTTPGLRVLEKWASAAGGVVNHRMGLWDAILIKNNHITMAGGVRAAAERAKSLGLPIEVEVRTRAEIEQALAAGAARLLLDNMTPDQAAEEIRFIRARLPQTEIEISGGVTLANVRAYAEAQPDFISSGSITHSATAVDINCGIYVIG